MRTRVVAAALASLALAASACRAGASQATKPAQTSVAWRELGSWSGHGNAQTESFTSDTGTLRVRWEAKARLDGDGPPGAGPLGSSGPSGPSGRSGPPARSGPLNPPGPPATFSVTAHSAISGRPLQQVVERAGAGAGIGYVSQDPHIFYMVVESSQLNWTFTVEEAIGYP